ncbi:MAG: bifunctional alpha/beta hydrolase/class I SAM-dependent methyltransferase [Bryobacterales bacterium]|nr:bifunctional alpha/beta hydrolase/class I SAM-dependent methyltransferase [Bryobacterales bacterium]
MNHGLGPRQLAVVAQSVGAVVAGCWVHDYAPPLRALVLAAPAFSIKLYVPLALPFLRLAQRAFGDFTVKSYVKAGLLTHDRQRAKSYHEDPQVTRDIASPLLIDLHDTSNRLVQDAAAITIPTQLLLSGADYVVNHKPQHSFFARLGSPIKELHTFDGFFHDTFGETQRHLPIAEARRFLLQQFDSTPSNACIPGPRAGFTWDEFQALSAALPPWKPSFWRFAMQRSALRVAACFSSGVHLGFQTGFDSGASLDYIYRNRPQGAWGIGRLIDRLYLDAPGWRGIRIRRAHLQRLLSDAMETTRRQGRPIRILDIAAGHGRYVLDLIQSRKGEVDNVQLRDFCPWNIRTGNQEIRRRGLDAIARFQQHDAFQRESYEGIQADNSIAIVSGLFELFPQNEPVCNALSGIASSLQPGGLLIYTGQPWHPQLEFIARTLPNHRGQAWVMRRRTQAELDHLVAGAGFRKLDQLTDRWGMFTVSLAERASA